MATNIVVTPQATAADVPIEVYMALRGEKGDKGDKGDTGSTGATGATGNGIASIALTGSTGTNPVVDTYTVTYTSGNTTTFTVTNGVKGDTGNTGATPAMSIGTVTTGNVGDDAAATLTGTTDNPVLNLSLPRGATGDVTNLAGTFSSSAAYSAGDHVIYNDLLYVFTADHAAGAWTGTDANQVKVGGELSDVKSDLDSYTTSISNYFEPINLYNKNSNLNRDGYKVSGSGDYVTQSGGSVSHPIKVEAGKTYSFKYSASFYGVLANSIVRPCDKDGNLILNALGDPVIYATTASGNGYGTFTVPIEFATYGYEYVCVNVRTSDKGGMIFAEGDTLPEYSDYFDPYWKIKSSALPSDMPLPLNVEANPLYGKKAAFTGDSICYGQGYLGGYAKIIGEENNMTISNIGVAGGTLCSGTNRFCISASVDNMPEEYDYYIVEGGVNDASQEHGETLGALSSGYNATLDTTTLYGAMESLCKKLQLNFKGKKYGFIIPHNTYGDTSAWNTGWRDAMKICLKKWGIPYLDLSDECAQLRNLDALRIYTSNSDGWHPTEDGYRDYYVPKITAWMKTL